MPFFFLYDHSAKDSFLAFYKFSSQENKSPVKYSNISDVIRTFVGVGWVA